MADISVDLLSHVVRIARRAGDEILSIYDSDIEVEYKGDESPLTQADKSSNDLIIRELDSLDLGYPILSEEGKTIPFAQRKTWHRYWLIDPLDGTKEFIKKNGEFTVNIALVENGQTILGVVYAPVLDVCYYAAKGLGAHKQTSDLDSNPIAVRRYQEGEVWNVVASRSHLSAETEALVAKLGSSEFVSMGSSLKLCLVAEGSAHLYPRLAPTSEWDTAAAQCIVEQAGGKVVTPELIPLQYNTKDSLLNPHFIVCYDVEDAWSKYLN